MHFKYAVGSQIDDYAVEQCLKYTATVDMIQGDHSPDTFSDNAWH